MKKYFIIFIALFFILPNHSKGADESLQPISDELITYQPIELVNYLRFDIMAKYYYAKHREMGVKSSWPLEVYQEHIRVWNNFNEIENGVKIKTGLKAYLDAYHRLLSSIKNEGFNPYKSIIPLGEGCIINGAHRIAASLLYNKEIVCQKVDAKGINATAYAYRHAKTHVATGLLEKYLDTMALQYCLLKKNTYIAFIFPCATSNRQQIRDIFNKHGTIVHKKKILLKDKGPLNLTLLMYEGEGWIGDLSNSYAGAQHHANQRFTKKNASGYYEVDVYLYEAASLEDVKLAKTEARRLDNRGNYPVHVNDTYDQTLIVAKSIFNANSIDFINRSTPTYHQKLDAFLNTFANFLSTNHLNPECFCIDGSGPLAAYGIRSCNDLDFIHFGYDGLDTGEADISSHNKELIYHKQSKDELIFNENNYFYYKGFKFSSLPVIKAMKQRRNEEKDKADVKLIDSF